MLLPRVIFTTFCLSAFLVLPSCEDTSEKTQAGIIGHWELTKALRNERETGTLEGVYFDFGPDGKMKTNLPVGAEVPVDYEVDKSIIIQKTPQPIRYQAVTIKDSLLVLQLEMRGMTFEMHMRRAEAPADTLVVPPADTTQQ
ncbi:MAG: hypothetical protein IT262_08355 [Saprospiraceae bacterium]|nr:hypothetical protein [Saprospiraceae bacterium]